MEVIGQLSLTMGAIFFLILLIVSYFSKRNQTTKTKGKIYKYLLITDFILIVLEIVTACLFAYQTSTFISYMSLRIRHLMDIAYFALLYLYYLSYFKDLEYDSLMELIKEDKSAKRYIIYASICALIYLFLPFTQMTGENYTFTPGLAYFFIVLYSVTAVIIVLVSTLRQKERLTNGNIISLIYLVFFMLIIIIFQILNPDIAILGLSGVIYLFSLYFIAENPDLYYIEEIEKLTNDVERASKTKQDFLSNMSHEIRTPMNAIVGFSEAVLNDHHFEKERAYEDIKHIESSSKNLLDIINNILDISKIESGKETLEEREYSISNLIDELSTIIKTRLEGKPIKWEVDIDKTVSSKLYGDATKLYQVLLNIVNNSVKYTEVGKIRLVLTHEIEGKYDILKFKISDTGFGIKKEDFDKLFEKFSRVDIVNNNEIEGTGLGLVITKQYVNLMGGQISFESDYGVGTTFYVEIPQRIIDYTEMGDYKAPTQTNPLKNLPDCSNYRVMIVDDNNLNLKVAVRLLSAYKFQIETATSGKECIYKYKEGTHYDMILIDHLMSEMDGIEAMHIIKKIEGYDTPIVVVYTANAIAGAREMYLKEGFDEYLSKPIDLTELNKIIEKHFVKDQPKKSEIDII